MSLITLKIDAELLEKVRNIAKEKYPLRSINKYAEAVREVLIQFIHENDDLKKEGK